MKHRQVARVLSRLGWTVVPSVNIDRWRSTDGWRSWERSTDGGLTWQRVA